MAFTVCKPGEGSSSLHPVRSPDHHTTTGAPRSRPCSQPRWRKTRMVLRSRRRQFHNRKCPVRMQFDGPQAEPNVHDLHNHLHAVHDDDLMAPDPMGRWIATDALAE
jgi:hypothetical protein